MPPLLASLEGILKRADDEHCVIIDVQGIGFKVYISSFSRSKLPEEGQRAALWIETIIRPEHIQLCGFTSSAEQYCFQKLILVQGVGVRAALAILSVCTPQAFFHAVQVKDSQMIEQASGIGKKIAQRILLELKDKLIPHPDLAAEAENAPVTHDQDINLQIVHDATEVLVQLGYAPVRVKPVVAELLSKDPTYSTQDIIRLALQKLALSL